jgi:hypothetical protein
MKPVTTAIKYFTKEELACKGTGIVKLDPRFAEALPKFREAWGEAVTPNSVCRTPEHNAKVGGNPNSLHMTENHKWPTLGCMAIDWPWRGWSVEKQIKFAKLAWSMGWSVGLHNAFCHLDRRADLGLPQLPQAVFLYGSNWENKFNKEQIVGS